MTDEEHERYWDELGGIREAIAADLSSGEPEIVLDVACGQGHYTIRLVESHPSGRVVAVACAPYKLEGNSNTFIWNATELCSD